MTRRLIHLLAIALFACLTQIPSFAADNHIDIDRAEIQSQEEGYKLSASFSFDLNRGLENAIAAGVPLYFTTDVEVARPRWYWLDEKAVEAKQTIRISYNVLTRQYTASVASGLQQHFRTLDEALTLVRRPPRWVVAEKDALITGETYSVAVRMRLDISQLPKPFQINAINNRDWRLSSDWKRFFYSAGR